MEQTGPLPCNGKWYTCHITRYILKYQNIYLSLLIDDLGYSNWLCHYKQGLCMNNTDTVMMKVEMSQHL